MTSSGLVLTHEVKVWLTYAIPVEAGEVVTQNFLESVVGRMERTSADSSMHLITLATTGSMSMPAGLVWMHCWVVTSVG